MVRKLQTELRQPIPYFADRVAGRPASRESVSQGWWVVVRAKVEIGPGSMRVEQFVGRLGVVTMPAIGHGLGLADRLVRRHVAKLEAVGWCERILAVRGNGSMVWLTAAGLRGVGLLDPPELRAPDPFSIRTMHTVRVAWAAAEIEHAGHRWNPARELPLAPGRWGAQVENERGGRSRRLPDLVFWPARGSGLPAAVVVVHRLPKPRREQAALEGWKQSITAGQYAQIRYLAPTAAADSLQRLATRIGLAPPQFIASDRLVPSEPALVLANTHEASTAVEATPMADADCPRRAPAHVPPERPHPEQHVETPEESAERQALIDELLATMTSLVAGAGNTSDLRSDRAVRHRQSRLAPLHARIMGVPTLPESLRLHGEEVVLRDWAAQDAPAIEPVCGEWNVCQFSSVPWVYSQPAARAWIDRQRDRRLSGSGLALAVTVNEGVPVGNVNLVRFSDDGREAALGYWRVPAARGQGLAVRSARMPCAWGFRQLHLERVGLDPSRKSRLPRRCRAQPGLVVPVATFVDALSDECR